MPMCCREEWDCPVEGLKNRIAQLEKEADWLALVLGKQDCPKNPTHCENLRSEQKITYAECMKCWREVAQMVVKDASNNA